MTSQRQFIESSPAISGVKATGLFVYQAAHPAAIEAGRIAASQDIPVVPFDAGRSEQFELDLRRLWSRDRVNIVGFTSEPGFDTARGLAEEHGFDLCHSAPSLDGELLHWIIGPTAV